MITRLTTRVKRWLLRVAVGLLAIYGVLFGAVAVAMMQPPERFGTFMKHMPAPVVWGALPAKRMWLWARSGALAQGDLAPDFNLRTTHDRTRRVTLSSYRSGRPVVLVFGSYT